MWKKVKQILKPKLLYVNKTKHTQKQQQQQQKQQKTKRQKE